MKVKENGEEEEEKNKGILSENEEIKLCLFTNNMVVYIAILKELTKNLLELVNNYSKFLGYTINIQKSTTFLYISD